MNADTLNALADRVEKLTGPDREVDALICATQFEVTFYPPDTPEACRPAAMVYYSPRRFGPQFLDIPVYTASLDAAMTLVPEGMELEITNLYGVARVAVGLNVEPGPFYASDECGSIVRALTAASLRARIASLATKE